MTIGHWQGLGRGKKTVPVPRDEPYRGGHRNGSATGTEHRHDMPGARRRLSVLTGISEGNRGDDEASPCRRSARRAGMPLPRLL